MQRYYKPFLAAFLLLSAGYGLWPVFMAHQVEIKAALSMLKQYSLFNPWAGYVIYAGILNIILVTGVPLATVTILLAGVIYDFWEGVALVLSCRLLAAMITFLMVRHFVGMPSRPKQKMPYLLQKFERHPSIGLLLARLAPIPDSIVSYTLAASPIKQGHYVTMSVVGMIPDTLLWVWAGNELSSIGQLMRWVQSD